jgi:DNA mismatch repair protein MutS
MDLAELYNTYKEINPKYPDAIKLFRADDLYLSFNEDATKLVDTIQVTGYDASGKFKYAYFNKEHFDKCLQILVRAGHRVAVCDQAAQKKIQAKPKPFAQIPLAF